MFTAETGRAGDLCDIGKRQRIMPPFTCIVIGSVVGPPSNSNPGPRATAQNDGIYHIESCSGSVDGFGSCKTIGIVFDSDFPANRFPQIFLHRFTDDPGRAGAFSEARFRIERSWNSNSDRTGFPGLLFDLLNETCDELNTTVIIVSGRRFAPSRQFFAIFSESNPLNLGSSPINADQHKRNVLTYCGSLSPLRFPGKEYEVKESRSANK